MELLSLMGSGMSSAEVATHMRLSRFTVNDYIERLKELLEVPDRTSLRRFAAQLGAGK